MSAASLPELLGSLLTLAGLSLLGVLIARSLFPGADGGLVTALGFPLGAGMFSWLAFLLSWAGVPLTAGTLVGAFGSICAVLVGYLVVRRREASAPRCEPDDIVGRDPLPGWVRGAGWLAVGMAVGAAAVLAVGLAYYAWDDIVIWCLKGYGIALEGSIHAGSHWGSMNLWYPLNIPVLVATIRILTADNLPGSKLLFPLFYASMLLGIIRYLRRSGVSPSLAVLGGVCIGTVPTVFEHATTGYANLPLAAYLVLGTLSLTEAKGRGETGLTVLGGTLLALAAWTRPEGLLMSTCCLAGAAGCRPWKHMGVGKWAIAVGVPLVIVIAPWSVFRSVYSSAVTVSELIRLAGQRILAGDIRWDAFYLIARYVAGQVVRLRAWGPTLIVGVLTVGLDLAIVRGERLRRLAETTLLTAGLLSLAVVGMYFVTAYGDDLYTWMSSGLNRMMMPAVVLLVVSSMLSLDRLLSKSGVGRRSAG